MKKKKKQDVCFPKLELSPFQGVEILRRAHLTIY